MKLSQYLSSTTRQRIKCLLPGLVLSTIVCLMLAGANVAQAADAANRQQAIDLALKQSGGAGKVLGVTESKSKNGETFYAVKVLTDGRIRVIRIKRSQ